MAEHHTPIQMHLLLLSQLLFAAAGTDTANVSTLKAPITSAQAVRVETAPVLDGKDTDKEWLTAPVIDNFLEYSPVTGAESRFRTELRILYDDKNLYFLGRMYDPEPDSIIALLSRRDVRTESEQLKLVIDSYLDRRTAFQFIVNPVGVKRDHFVYNETNEDANWDGVWDVATSIDSLGWTAEFRIPFSQLRFSSSESPTFGLLVVRDIARTQQRLSWPLIRRELNGYVSQAGTITGISSIPSPRRLELLPYMVSSNKPLSKSDGSIHRIQKQSFGADIKWGISSNLTVDATINPDFGQVEADPSVINLSAFEQFYSEKRPFFIEGTSIFDFSIMCENGCTGLFYSRRIGRSPQLGSTFYSPDNPMSSRVLGAVKLSGRLSSGTNIGIMNASTARETGAGDKTIEPFTNYSTARLMHEMRNGQSSVGVMATSVNRSLDEYTEGALRKDAYSGGIDFRHQFLNRMYELEGYVAGSLIKGSSKAIEATQTDGVHRYQREDDRLFLDSTRTSLSGDAQMISLSRIGGQKVRFESLYQRMSAGFETNDMGFQTRADLQVYRNWIGFISRNPGKYHRYAQLNFNTYNSWTTEGLPLQSRLNTNFNVELPNTSGIYFNVNAGLPGTFNDRDARGGPAFRRSTNGNFSLGWSGDSRRSIKKEFYAGGSYSDEGKSRGWWVEPYLNIQVLPNMNISTSASYSRGITDAQWYANYGDTRTDTTHYTFAKLDRHTLAMSGRIDYTVTPSLSFQFYAQPFVALGTYSNLRELGDPRSKSYDERFVPYSTTESLRTMNVRELITNSVLRWEFRPGSTLFVVWQQGRSGDNGLSDDFSFGRNVREVFDIRPENSFLVKFSYWFNP